MLTQELLKHHLHYDVDTGLFTWLVPRANRCTIGQVAGTLHSRGYVHVRLFNVIYKAHRLAFLYMTGKWPENCVDHINDVWSDNRWCNLRDVTYQENSYNRKGATKASKTGLLGSSKQPNGKYRAQIMHKNKVHNLGTYDSPIEAHEAYLQARKDFNILIF